MTGYRKIKIVSLLALLFSLLFMFGCRKPEQSETMLEMTTYEPKLDDTIGGLADVIFADQILVEGYALVGGLNGTGSSECPPAIRMQLEKYIRKQVPATTDAARFIDSQNTAVVYMQGLMPAATAPDQRFDVRVAALTGTQTTSLYGGELWGAELKEAGKFGRTLKVMAQVEGPVFIDMIETPANETQGYILAGGKVLGEYGISLALRKPDYKLAGIIRNRVNERFGYDTAKAIGPGAINLKVPSKYAGQKSRFIQILRATYLTDQPEFIEQQINAFIRKLAVSRDKWQSEIALEAIGKKSLTKLNALLNSSDPEVRFRTARCMLNLGSNKALQTLSDIAYNQRSPFRVDALHAITAVAKRNDATSIARRLLRDPDPDIRLAAYEELRRLDDISIIRSIVGQNFHLEQVSQTDAKTVFVSRSGDPRVVLFGAPLYARDNIFIQSRNGDIIINAPAGQKYVEIMRKLPRRPHLPPVKLRSSFMVSDIIRTLGELPTVEKDSPLKPGLGVPYSDILIILKQMCEKGAIDADFKLGELPKIAQIVKK